MANTPAAAAGPLTFDTFWKWLQDHRGCVLRAASPDVSVFDHEALHWDFFEEDDGRAVCQALLGKALVAEFIIEPSDVVLVQASPDIEDPQRNAWLFECLGGTREDSYPQFSFLLNHGMEGSQAHQMLKH